MARLGNTANSRMNGPIGKLDVMTNAGAPTNGTSGTGVGIAPKNTFLIDTTNSNLYINSGTVTSPVWKLYTRA